jgi:DNA adenine methylase
MHTPLLYYGGKQRLAQTIIAMMPAHRMYVEPFFGGGAVFFAKPKGAFEVINDKDNRLILFYQVVRSCFFDELKLRIDQTLHSEYLYNHAKNCLYNQDDCDDIELAWAVWVCSNMSFSGTFRGGWKNDNGSPKNNSHVGIGTKHRRERFSERLHERLETVQISCRDALGAIAARDAADTFFYIDPPYPGANQQHYAGYTHNDLYELLQLLSTIKGKFILSQHWSQTLRYHILRYGWHFKAIEMPLQLTKLAGTKADKQTRTEILVYNYELPQDLFTQPSTHEKD